MDAIVKHVEAKKWNSVEHYHRAGSAASKIYSVNGVPHVMLIDKTGRIVFKGHPATRPDLEKDIDTLLKGEALTGDGAASAPKEGADESEEKIPEGLKEFDLEKLNSEIEEFKKACAAMTANSDLVAAAKEMPRKFCVITLTQVYFPSTGKSLYKYVNHRVLVGKQESIDLLMGHFEENVKGSFEINKQTRAM